MTQVVFSLVLFLVTALLPLQAFAGAPTSLIAINGPGIPPEGIEIRLDSKKVFLPYPGAMTFIDWEDRSKEPVSRPKPPSDWSHYSLVFYAAPIDRKPSDQDQFVCTLLYVWNHHSDQAFIYLPGPSDLGYRLNYPFYGIGFPTSSNPQDPKCVFNFRHAGKWFYASKQLDNIIRKKLPKASVSVKKK